MEPERSPVEIRETFGKNLKKLIDGSPISRVSQDLNMSRTKIYRFLAHEAWPKPNELYRICVYFDVDARILLDPYSLRSLVS